MFKLLTKLEKKFPLYREPVEPHPQRAAVLVVLYEKGNKDRLLLTRRSQKMHNHAGEVCFPGGVFQEKDGNLLKTALRETEEEIHIQVHESMVIARLPMVYTLTGYEVTPFVAKVEGVSKFKLNWDEVEAVFEAPLYALLATEQSDPGSNGSAPKPVFCYKQDRIWGATAAILKEIAKLHALSS